MYFGVLYFWFIAKYELGTLIHSGSIIESLHLNVALNWHE